MAFDASFVDKVLDTQKPYSASHTINRVPCAFCDKARDVAAVVLVVGTIAALGYLVMHA